MFGLHNEVRGGGGEVIQKRQFAIADTHAPVSAISLSHFCYLMAQSRRNQICPVGHHQGAYRLTPLGLHRIESVSSRHRMLPDKRRTWTLHVRIKSWTECDWAGVKTQKSLESVALKPIIKGRYSLPFLTTAATVLCLQRGIRAGIC